MPVVHFYIPECIPNHRVLALADCVHIALVETSRVPETDRFHIIHRLPESSLIMDPHFPDVTRSAESCIIEVLYIEGRTPQEKANFFKRTVSLAEAAGFRPDDLMMTFCENGRHDWSPGGGRCF